MGNATAYRVDVLTPYGTRIGFLTQVGNTLRVTFEFGGETPATFPADIAEQTTQMWGDYFATKGTGYTAAVRKADE